VSGVVCPRGEALEQRGHDRVSGAIGDASVKGNVRVEQLIGCRRRIDLLQPLRKGA